MFSKKKKQSIIKSSARHEKDTGSPEVQVAVLSKRIENVAKHLEKNRQDTHSRRGLLKLVAKKRKHETYLRKTSSKKTASSK